MPPYRGRRYPGPMENKDKRDRSLALGWLLVAVQVVLFLAVAFWPSSWGPTVRAARELAGPLFFLRGLGLIGAPDAPRRRSCHDRRGRTTRLRAHERLALSAPRTTARRPPRGTARLGLRRAASPRQVICRA